MLRRFFRFSILALEIGEFCVWHCERLRLLYPDDAAGATKERNERKPVYFLQPAPLTVLPTWRMRNPDVFVILVPEENMTNWSDLSNDLDKTVQAVGKGVITVQAEGNRTVSGIVLDERTIVTTASAIGDGEKIRVWVSPDRQIDASVIGGDRGTDIALLKPDQQVGSPAAFAEDPKLGVGQLVLAIGRTWRGNLVASSGILSGLMGEWLTPRGEKVESFIRPDLNLYSGFSGGALVGADSKVIGMNTDALRRRSSVAIPYSTIKRVAAVLREKGHIPKPYLGVGLQPVRLPESLTQRLNLTQDVGALVVHVESASPADKAELLPGDILLGVDEQNFGHHGPTSLVFRLEPNRDAKIAGIRGGQHFSTTIHVGERPRRQA
jgi:S1-C subfamily serine protease